MSLKPLSIDIPQRFAFTPNGSLDSPSIPAPTLAALRRERGSVSREEAASVISTTSSRATISFSEVSAQMPLEETGIAMSNRVPHLRGGECLNPEADPDTSSIFDFGDVLADDPCQQEHKKPKLSFFSRRKPAAPKPSNPGSKSHFKLRMPSISVPSMLRRQKPSTNPYSFPPPKPSTHKTTRGHGLQTEMFFDYEVEERTQSLLHLANNSTLTLKLESVEDMEMVNASLPSLVL
ncbi:hypothetical protein G7Y79_00002g007780 [Physcia stellaris]|nr:hypothetical protein G7Y79_00002g007780 [Physcia stellaris]